MYAAIRVRGTTGVKGEIADTMKMLKLNRINHAVVIPENPNYQGMLQKAKDYITWGEVTENTMVKVIAKRGRLPGGEKLTEEYLKEKTAHKSVEELTKAIFSGEKLEDNGIKPVFRLHPPRKGYKNTKKAFNEDGTLGYRGEKIEDLLKKMI